MRVFSDSIQLRKFVVPEIVFGLDSRYLAAQYARNLGARKVLLVTDEKIQGAGWAEDVEETLKDARIRYAVYSDVTPNPRTEEVMEGVDLFSKEKCDALLAIGGGSVIDCAKGIGIVSSNGGEITDYEGTDRITRPIPPIICIPTTAGTAADISQFAVFMDVERSLKFCVISKSLVPDVSLVDPVTTTTMSPRLTAETGLDALSHAIEAFVSTGNSPLTDLHAIEAIRIIARYLPLAVEKGDDLEVRSNMMLGSLHAGIAFSNANLGAIHAMSHSLGGFLDLPHGECNAILLEHVVAYNFESSPNRYEEIARAMGIDVEGMYYPEKKNVLVNALAELRRRVNIRQKLRNLGVRKTDIPKLAEMAMKDPCMTTNPRRLQQNDVEVIYERAF
ncbi:MAG: iron-containing alcohol dehydrogenase [Methanomassiliicoccales archaeon]|jgi:alcohol dehydrogenase class IV|nr:iron-containing alcohol dehydrogenase [Methanomassiliicoccales archaeon]